MHRLPKLTKNQGIWIIEMVILSLFIPPLAEGNTSDEEAVAKLRECLRSQQAFDHVAYHEIEEIVYTPGGEKPRKQKNERRCLRDGDRLDIKALLRNMDNKGEELSFGAHEVIKGKERVTCSWSLADKKKTSGSVSKKDGLGMIARNGGALEGYFITACPQERITSVLQKSQDLKIHGEEEIEGVQCIKISGTLRNEHGSLGNFSLWLSRSQGFLPKKIVHEVSERDINLVTGKPFSELKYPDPDNSNDHILSKGLTEIVEHVSIKQVGNVFVTVGGRVSRIEKYSKGNDDITGAEITRTDILVQPTSPREAFTIPELREGTILGNDDQPSGIIYEWRNGEAVPVSADFTADAGEPRKGRSIWLVVIWGFGGVMLLVVAVRALWRTIKGSQGAEQ